MNGEDNLEKEVETGAKKGENAGEGLSEEDFSALLSSIGGAAPLLQGLVGTLPLFGKKSGACVGREALLLALKPYLSPTRCEAVDYLIRLGRIGDTLRALK